MLEIFEMPPTWAVYLATFGAIVAISLITYYLWRYALLSFAAAITLSIVAWWGECLPIQDPPIPVVAFGFWILGVIYSFVKCGRKTESKEVK